MGIKICEYCGGDIAIRNPTGKCDHLYYPDYYKKEPMEKTVEQLSQEAAVMVRGSEFMEITTRQEYDLAAKRIQAVAGFTRQIKEYWEEKIASAFKTHKLLCAERTKMLTPLENYIIFAKKAADTFLDIQERQQAEAAAKIKAMAEKVAREQAEAAAKALNEAALASKAAKTAKEAEQAAEAAKAAQAKAQAAQEAQEAVSMAPVSAPQVDAGDGMSRVEVWKWELVDKAAVPEDYKILDEKRINGVVKAMKDSAKIAGLRVFMVKELRRAGR